jgi:ABC-type dipeptide/oligopeptide/nickel transport system permease subunit
MGSEWILRRLAGGVEWIQLAQDRGLWRAVVNAVMNLLILAPRSLLLFSFIVIVVRPIIIIIITISFVAVVSTAQCCKSQEF